MYSTIIRNRKTRIIVSVLLGAALLASSIVVNPGAAYAAGSGCTVKGNAKVNLSTVQSLILELKKTDGADGKKTYFSSKKTWTHINDRKLSKEEKKVVNKRGGSTIFVYNTKTKKLAVETASKYYKKPGMNDVFYEKSGNLVRFGNAAWADYMDKNFKWVRGENKADADKAHRFTLTTAYTFKKIPVGTYKLEVEGKTVIKKVKLSKPGKTVKLKDVKYYYYWPK
jgi:hypothetical protein